MLPGIDNRLGVLYCISTRILILQGLKDAPMTEKPDRKPWLQYSVAGKAFILPVLVLMGLGWLLDRWTGLYPGFSVLGAIVGFFLGLWILIRIEKRLVDQEAQRHRNRSTTKNPSSTDDNNEDSPRNSRDGSALHFSNTTSKPKG